MKEIGELLKATREKNGVTVEEAADDLSLRVSQINSIENGDLKAFKDVYYLKFFVRDYAKYLGLDSDAILDDFNEFIFDYTSRIPTEQIEKTKKEKTREPKKIASPYTTSKNLKIDFPPIIVYVIIGILLLVIGYILIGMFSKDNFQTENIKVNLGDGQYEFSK